MSINSIKKIKITLEYLTNSVNIEVEPYRPISYLREKAKKIYFPLNFEIKLIYSNKDLTPLDNITIGDFFKNKSTIFIKIVQILTMPSKIDNLKNYDNIQSYGEFKQNLNIQNTDDYNSNSINRDFNNLNNYPNFINSSPHYNNMNQNIQDKYILCQCRGDIVTYYCRNDNSFLCKNCRLNNFHKNHIFVHIETSNLEESIKLYAISLQSDISLTAKASKQYNTNFQINQLIEPSSRKEIILRKLDELEKKQEEILKNIPKLENQNIDNLMKEYNIKAQKSNEEIEEILDGIYINYTKKKKKISLENATEIFNKINLNEKEIEKLSTELNNYKINFNIYKKIDEMYKIIDKALDAVLTNDINISINLEDSLLNLEMIKSLKKNNTKIIKENLNNISVNRSMNSITYNKKELNSESIFIRPYAGDKNKNNSNKQGYNRIAIEAVDKTNSENIEKGKEDKLKYINNNRKVIKNVERKN